MQTRLPIFASAFPALFLLRSFAAHPLASAFRLSFRQHSETFLVPRRSISVGFAKVPQVRDKAGIRPRVKVKGVTPERGSDARKRRCMETRSRLSRSQLLDRIHQRGQSLDAYLQPITRSDWAYATWSARQNDVTGQKGQVGGDETHQFVAVENQLVGVRILS